MNSYEPEQPQTERRFTAIQLLRLAGTLAAGILVIYLFIKHWNEITQAVRQIPIWLFFVLFLIMMVSRLAVAGRWHVLLRAAGVPISATQSAKITFAGLFANNFLPTTIGGDVARLAAAMLQGYDRAICLASLVVDRLVGMTGMAMILPFGLPGLIKVLPSGAALFHSSNSLLVGAALSREGWLKQSWERGVHILKRLFWALALWKKNPKSLLFALGCSWIHMVCFILFQRLLLDSLGQTISTFLIAGLWSITYFVTQLPVSINGWGVQELSLTFLFTRVGGITTESSLTLALLLRVLQMLASLPGALFVPGVVTRQGLRK
jgi:uncharacterized membrane protein YbhN (UPF0104 family)